MVKIIGAIVLGIIAIVCFVISFLQFNEKGFLFNNAYIGASKQDRETMNKKPHYKQSGVVFALIGIIFLINAIEMILQMHRTLKDNNLRVRALRRARELREVSASLFFLALFLFITVHSTLLPPLSTIMVENQRR